MTWTWSWLASPLFIAILGFAAKYVNDVRLARRKDALDRVNKQLADLYGPMLACASASSIAWQEFRRRYRPGRPYFDDDPPPSPGELEAWRLWITEVFMPLNLRIEKAVMEHADLLRESEMPLCLRELCAHISAYKLVLKRWQNGDHSEHTSVVNYPPDVDEYARRSYDALKAEQGRLLGLTSGAPSRTAG